MCYDDSVKLLATRLRVHDGEHVPVECVPVWLRNSMSGPTDAVYCSILSDQESRWKTATSNPSMANCAMSV
jgi:hypothetical protein